MTTVFLYTFFVGFGLTAASVIMGAISAGAGHGGDFGHGDFGHGDAGVHGHFGHGDVGHAGHLGHGDLGHGDLGHSDLAHGDHGDLSHTHPSGKGTGISPFNFQTIVAFLMGFGGVGYLMANGGLAALLVIPAAGVGGLTISWMIYRWLRFLLRGERPMAPSSYVGLSGQLTVGIRPGGTGELVYTQNGTRMVTSARSHDGTPIAKGETVVVLRYEKGVAYVEPISDLLTTSSRPQ